MKVTPISRSTSFKGIMTDYQIIKGAGDLRNNSHWHNNASVENTVGAFHQNYTGKVYFADPLEPVSDRIKETADYIVHDREPRFPDMDREVSKLYFFPQNRSNKEKELASDINKYREYFYRLEMADSKTVGEYERQAWYNNDPAKAREKADYFKAHVNDAKYNQETSAACLGILEESKPMRDKKDAIYSEIEALEELIKKREADLPKSKTELAQRKALEGVIADRLAALDVKERLYSGLEENLKTSSKTNSAGVKITAQALEYNDRHHSYADRGAVFKEFLAKPVSTEAYASVNKALTNAELIEKEEAAKVKSGLKAIRETKEFYTQEAGKNKDYIKKIEQYVKELPGIIDKLERDLALKKHDFEKIKADLIPHFDKLKNYFYSRGLRNIR